MAPRKGRVIVFYNRKGGPGKTTLAFHYAVYLQTIEVPVILLDLDDQGDATTILTRRADRYPEAAVMRSSQARTVEEVEAVLHAATSNGVDVVVDCPPQDLEIVAAACEACDAIVAPLIPGGNDALAIGRVARYYTSLSNRPPLLAVINRYRGRGVAERNLESFLKTAGIFHLIGHLSQSNNYRDAVEECLAVWEHNPKSPVASEAQEVVKALHRVVTGARR